MSVLSLASGKSAYRGYDYYIDKKVLRVDKIEENLYSALVSGSDNMVYEITLDIKHPKRSQCTCPHAAGKQIICKHKVAVYFEIFPEEAQRYIEELEAAWEEEEDEEFDDEYTEIGWPRNEYAEEELVRYVKQMKKTELQEELLRMLLDGPDWQFGRFINEHLDLY